MSISWPEKKTSIGPMGDDERDMLIYNAAREDCIKAWEKSPKMAPLNRDALYKIMKSTQAFEGDEFHECLEKILSNLGTPPAKPRPVVTVEELLKIFDSFNDYRGDIKNGKLKMAKAIVKKLEEGK